MTAKLPRAPFERILKKAGARRVSFGALDEFAKVMEDIIFDISKQAAVFAKHAGRKTILDSDVRMAKRKA
jgi:histone H3/H4